MMAETQIVIFLGLIGHWSWSNIVKQRETEQPYLAIFNPNENDFLTLFIELDKFWMFANIFDLGLSYLGSSHGFEQCSY